MTTSTGRKGFGTGGSRVRRDEAGLSFPERLFVGHYMGAARGNATEAVVLSGHPGTRAAAATRACEYMSRPHVLAEIDRLTAERNERLQFDADDVLRELLRLKVDAEGLTKGVQSLRLRREVLKDLGDHVQVGAFRRQVGLSAPGGGPIETVDLAALAGLSDEELDTLERARSIIDRTTGSASDDPERGGDPSRAGAPAGAA